MILPCQPALADRPPSGPGWLHEIKFDGYWVIARKDGEQVRLWARTTSDYSNNFTRIRDAVAALPVDSAVLDGEAIVLRPGATPFRSPEIASGAGRGDLGPPMRHGGRRPGRAPGASGRAQEEAIIQSSLLCEHENRLRSPMGKKGSVTQAEAVQRFLQQNAGKEFCHKCLAKAVGIKSVNRYIFQLINNPFFVRRRGRCEACASHRPKLLARYRESLHRTNKTSYRSAEVRLWARTKSARSRTKSGAERPNAITFG